MIVNIEVPTPKTDKLRDKNPLPIRSKNMAEVLDSHEQLEMELRKAKERIKYLEGKWNWRKYLLNYRKGAHYVDANGKNIGKRLPVSP